MATAFSLREREQIYESLQDAAMRLASTVGMKHATVEELAHEAGISKGTFYRFFTSKEHLFLSMLERMHNEMYGSADSVFETRADLNVRDRTILAIQEVFRVAEKHDAVSFIRGDVPFLLRRLPEELLQEHYTSDSERIKALIIKSKVKLNTDIDTACTVIRLLLMALLNKNDVGKRFDEAICLMIEGACDRFIVEE